MSDPFASIYNSPTAVATQDSSVDPFASIYGNSKPAPSAPVSTKTQDFKGQQIPANIPTKNLVSYDAVTGNKTFNLGNASGGVYTEDKNGNIVKGGHTTYGGVAPVSGMQRDDIIPQGLGGTNSNKGNISLIPNDIAHKQDTVESQLSQDVRTGKAQPKAAINSALAQKDEIASQPGFWGKVGNVIGDVGRGLKTGADMITGKTESTDFVANPITAVINMYKKPSEIVQKQEATLPNIPILKQAGQAVIRSLTPLVEGFGTNIGSGILGQNELSNEVANNKTKQTVGTQAQSNASENQVTHKLTAEDVVNVALNSIQVGLLFTPLISEGLKTGSLKLADAISENSKVPITYEDLQKITTSTSDAQAQARVGVEKLNAYKEATQTNAVKQSLKQGYIELAQKDPNTFANILRNAATRPVSEIGNIADSYGQSIQTSTPTLLPEKATMLSREKASFLSSHELSDYINFKENGTDVYIIKQLPEPPKLAALESTDSPKLLTAPSKNFVPSPIEGKGFTMSDKPNKILVQRSKALNNYRESVQNYNKAPTPYKLNIALKAKHAYMDIVAPQKIEATAPFAHELNAPKVPDMAPFAHEVTTRPFAAEIAEKAATKPVTAPETPRTTENLISSIPKPVKASTEVPIESKAVEGKTPSKIAQSIEQKAVETSLSKGFEGVAGYDKITIKDQAERATKLMSNPEEAMSIIRGEKPLPEGLRGTALITAAEEHIKVTGDVKMAYELANSPLVSGTSAAAQELRLAAEREPDSATAKIQEIKKAQIEKAGGHKAASAKKTEVMKTLKEATTKVHLTKEELSWDKFLQEIQC